jgi:protein O-GlcNAc transferase
MKAPNLVSEALNHYRRGDFKRAEQLARKALAAAPRNPNLLQVVALTLTAQNRANEAIDLLERAINIGIPTGDTLYNLGTALMMTGRHGEAAERLRQACALRPQDPDCHNNLGIALLFIHRSADAEVAFDRALMLRPDWPTALVNRGRAAAAQGKHQEALNAYSRVIGKFASAELLLDMANSLCELKRSAEALASYDRALAIKPNFAEAHYNRGNLQIYLKRPAEALANYDQALALKPNFAEAIVNRGIALMELGQLDAALTSVDKAIALKSDFPIAHCKRGNILLRLGRLDGALESYDNAIVLAPHHAEAHFGRGHTLLHLKRWHEALVSFETAIAIKSDYAEAYSSHADVLLRLGRRDQALASCEKAIALKPEFAEGHNSHGDVLMSLNRPDEALTSYDKALSLDPDHIWAFGNAAAAAMYSCDWARTRQIAGTLDQRVAQGRSIISPFKLLAYPCKPETQLNNTRKFIQDRNWTRPVPLSDGTSYGHQRIRIAYLSADFREHAMAYQMAELFEVHDRTRFEVLGISFGPDDGSGMRKRAAASFDAFIDVRQMSDFEVASLLRHREVDIAIDLMGYTEGSRCEILAYRPARVQTAYLGYPGTMAAEFIDYVIADPVVLPFDQQPYYTEKIVHLPDCYQVNDRKRLIATETLTRNAAGLPQTGFVFCCFNSNYKITREVFDVWMRLLREIEGSILWLVGDNAVAMRNLRTEAQGKGVSPERLVFADRLPPDRHLARHRLADLFLDTLPYNAHGTGSMALWAGLPFITCMGETFQGRVGASLLIAAGLPELVTSSLEEYERLAKLLASNPVALQAFKRKLEQNLPTCSLFDTDRFRRHIEAAYMGMWERIERGLPVESFSVTALP